MSTSELERLEAGVAEARAAGEPCRLARRLERLGTHHLRAGRGGTAVVCLGEAAVLADVAGQERLRARILGCLALAHGWQGDEEAAVQSAQGAVALGRACGERRDEAFALCVLGAVLADFGRTAESLAARSEALEVSRAIGDPEGEAEALAGRARVRLREPATDREAIADLLRALALREGLGDRAGQAECLHLLGVAHLHLRDPDAAEEPLARALALAREVGADEVAPALLALSAVHARRRDLPRAVAFAEEGLAVAREQGERLSELRCLWTLADLRRRQGRLLEALRLSVAAVRVDITGIGPRKARELRRDGLRGARRLLLGRD